MRLSTELFCSHQWDVFIKKVVHIHHSLQIEVKLSMRFTSREFSLKRMPSRKQSGVFGVKIGAVTKWVTLPVNPVCDWYKYTIYRFNKNMGITLFSLIKVKKMNSILVNNKHVTLYDSSHISSLIKSKYYPIFLDTFKTEIFCIWIVPHPHH